MLEFNAEKRKDVCKEFKSVSVDVGKLSKLIDIQEFQDEDEAVDSYKTFMDEYERVRDNLERARKDVTLLFDSVVNW